MEGIDTNWDDLLHDSLHYPPETLGHQDDLSALHTYDVEVGSGIWGTQSRRNDPLAILGSIGAIPPFDPYSSKSSDSSPMLSDDYMYFPDELRRTSNSTMSSEDTISPKDSVFLHADIAENLGYFSKPPSAFSSPPIYVDTPAPMSPNSPHPIPRSFTRTQPEVKHKSADAPQSTRRRAAKTTSTPSNTGTKMSTVSNNNNSKPMTARDRKRRQMHNASAMRSRIRLNETLDKMWKTIPLARRRKRLSNNPENGDNEPMEDLEEDEEERIGRADKVEVGIDYILYLEERVRELEARLSVAH